MELINVNFLATGETSREVYYTSQHAWMVKIPWNHADVTATMRHWASIGWSRESFTWKHPVIEEPSVEYAITLIGPEMDKAMQERSAYLRRVLAAIEDVVRAGQAGMLRDDMRRTIQYPALELLGVNRPPHHQFSVIPEWHTVLDAAAAAHDGVPTLEEWFARRCAPYYEQLLDLYKHASDAQSATLAAQAEQARADRAAAELAAANREADQRATLDAVVRATLDPGTIDWERWVDGTVSEREVRGWIRRYLFAPPAGQELRPAGEDHEDLPRYRRMTAQEISPDHPDLVVFDTDGPYYGSLTRTEWVRQQQALALFEDLSARVIANVGGILPWTFELRVHRAYITRIAREFVRQVITARIAVQVGPWTLSREYALSDQDTKEVSDEN